MNLLICIDMFVYVYEHDFVHLHFAFIVIFYLLTISTIVAQSMAFPWKNSMR